MQRVSLFLGWLAGFGLRAAFGVPGLSARSVDRGRSPELLGCPGLQLPAPISQSAALAAAGSQAGLAGQELIHARLRASRAHGWLGSAAPPTASERAKQRVTRAPFAGAAGGEKKEGKRSIIKEEILALGGALGKAEDGDGGGSPPRSRPSIPPFRPQPNPTQPRREIQPLSPLWSTTGPLARGGGVPRTSWGCTRCRVFGASEV